MVQPTRHTDEISPLVPLAIGATVLITTVALVQLTRLGEGWKRWVILGGGVSVAALSMVATLRKIRDAEEREIPPPPDPVVDPLEAFRARIPAQVDFSDINGIDEGALIALFAEPQPQITEIAFPRACRDATVQAVVEKCPNLERLDLSAFASERWNLQQLNGLLNMAPRLVEVVLPTGRDAPELSGIQVERRVVFRIGHEEHIHCPWQALFPPGLPLPAVVDLSSATNLDEAVFERLFDAEQPHVTDLTLSADIRSFDSILSAEAQSFDSVLKVIERCPRLEKVTSVTELLDWQLKGIKSRRELTIIHSGGEYRHIPLEARYPEGEQLPPVLDLSEITGGWERLKDRFEQPQDQVTKILGTAKLSVSDIVDISKHCRNLSELDLTDWDVYWFRSRSCLDDILSNCPKLTQVHVSEDRAVYWLKCMRAVTFVCFERRIEYFPPEALLENGQLPREVDLSQVNKHGRDAKKLFQQQQPQVRKVNVSGARWADLNFVKLVLEQCPNLELLNIQGIRGSVEEAIQLELPSSLDLNQSISISGQSFGDERDYKWQIEGRPEDEIDLRAFPGLAEQRHLDALLAREPENVTRICLAGALELKPAQILQIIRACPNVRTLDLTRCRQLRDKHLEAIAEEAKELRELNLTFCQRITNKGIAYLKAPLEKLVLNECSGLDGTGLLDALIPIETLTSLTLLYVPNTDEEFWAGLHKLSALRELGGEPKFGKKEGEDGKTYGVIPSILGNGSQLESLHLRCRTPVLRRAVIQGLPNLKRIKFAAPCLFTQEDLKSLQVHAERLEVLDLSRADLGHPMAKAALTEFPKLQELRLPSGRFRMSGDGFQTLFRTFVQGRENLRVLALDEELREEDLDLLVQAAPNLEVLKLRTDGLLHECCQKVLDGLHKLREVDLWGGYGGAQLTGSFPNIRRVSYKTSGDLEGDLPRLFPAAHTVSGLLGERKLEAYFDELHCLTEELKIFLHSSAVGVKRYDACLALKGPFPRVHKLTLDGWTKEHQEGFEKLFELFPNLVTLEHRSCELDFSKAPKSVMLHKK